MLLPDNIHPEHSIFYNGSLVLIELQKKPVQVIMDLFQNVKAEHSMSFSIFILCLDWLYLIDVAELNDVGEVKLCS
ncbi:ABC-three component system middle component 6 [Paenibacillus sp. 2RAB27]|uniref:ABC-three component system middle component 6 n=1 Tax=Paenibacillus sp. 2RAB27 TaxID=3232991 RepID=UPI003F9D60A6